MKQKDIDMLGWRIVYIGLVVLGMLFLGLGELIIKSGWYLIAIGIVSGIIIEILHSKGKLTELNIPKIQKKK